MKKKRIFCLTVVLIAILVGGYFYANVEKKHALYNTGFENQQLQPNVNTEPGKSVEYCFTCEHSKLSSIWIFAITKGDLKNHSLDYTLLAKDGSELANGSIKANKIKSGKFTSLDFDTIEDSKGKDFIIRVTTDCAPTDVRICTEPVGDKWAIRYGYRTWSLETMIVFDFLALFLVAFIVVLQKLFRK